MEVKENIRCELVMEREQDIKVKADAKRKFTLNSVLYRFLLLCKLCAFAVYTSLERFSIPLSGN